MSFKELSNNHRRTVGDLLDRVRWDHVWLYELFERLRMTKARGSNG